MSNSVIMLHDIESVQLDVARRATESGEQYYVHNLVLSDKDGNETGLTLFGPVHLNFTQNGDIVDETGDIVL